LLGTYLSALENLVGPLKKLNNRHRMTSWNHFFSPIDTHIPSNVTTVGTTQFQFHTELLLYFSSVAVCFSSILRANRQRGEPKKKKKMFYTLGIVHSTHLLSWIACGKRQPSRRSTNRENPGTQTTKTFRCVFFSIDFYRTAYIRVYYTNGDCCSASKRRL
jgi:hypothetical protein